MRRAIAFLVKDGTSIETGWRVCAAPSSLSRRFRTPYCISTIVTPATHWQVTGWYPFNPAAENYPKHNQMLSVTVDPKGPQHVAQLLPKVKLLRPQENQMGVLLRAQGTSSKSVILRKAALEGFNKSFVQPAAEARAEREKVNAAKGVKPRRPKAGNTSHGAWVTPEFVHACETEKQERQDKTDEKIQRKAIKEQKAREKQTAAVLAAVPMEQQLAEEEDQKVGLQKLKKKGLLTLVAARGGGKPKQSETKNDDLIKLLLTLPPSHAIATAGAATSDDWDESPPPPPPTPARKRSSSSIAPSAPVRRTRRKPS